MYKKKVIFYRNDRLMNNELSRYIMNHIVTDARMVTFTDDDYLYDFIYEDMEEREWWGVMSGIRVTTTEGDVVIFASWDDGKEKIQEPNTICSQLDDFLKRVTIALATQN